MSRISSWMSKPRAKIPRLNPLTFGPLLDICTCKLIIPKLKTITGYWKSRSTGKMMANLFLTTAGSHPHQNTPSQKLADKKTTIVFSFPMRRAPSVWVRQQVTGCFCFMPDYFLKKKQKTAVNCVSFWLRTPFHSFLKIMWREKSCGSCQKLG